MRCAPSSRASVVSRLHRSTMRWTDASCSSVKGSISSNCASAIRAASGLQSWCCRLTGRFIPAAIVASSPVASNFPPAFDRFTK